MWPYFALIAVILLMQIKWNRHVTKIQFYIGIIALFLFSALRGNDNGDYFAYLNYGWNIKTWHDVFYSHEAMEIGYRIIALMVNYLGLPRQFIIITMNFISLACISKFIRKYSKDWCLSLLLFLPLFFQFDMHAARTAVAISISSLSIGYVLERKLFKFIIIVLLAMMFHAVAVIVMPLYVVYSVKLSWMPGLLLIGFEMLFIKVIGFDSLAIAILDVMGLDSFRNRYLQYAVVKADIYGYPFSLLDPRLLILIVIFVFAHKAIKNKGKFEYLLINSCFLNIILLILFSEHTALACRISSFYNVYTIILIPVIMTNLHRGFSNYIDKCAGVKNNILSRIGCIIFYVLFACAYSYVCFIATGVEYRLFF